MASRKIIQNHLAVDELPATLFYTRLERSPASKPTLFI